MKIIEIEGHKIGILNQQEYQERTINIAKGIEVENPELKLFASDEEGAKRCVKLKGIEKVFICKKEDCKYCNINTLDDTCDALLEVRLKCPEYNK